MLERAVEILKSGNPENWPKTKENKEKVVEMARVLKGLTNNCVECSWCARGEIYKNLVKWMKGNGHL
jgi:hypothetical protein